MKKKLNNNHYISCPVNFYNELAGQDDKVMKIKLNQALVKMDGEKMFKEEAINGKMIETKNEFQLKDVCVNSLLANVEKEEIDGVEKMNRYLLATKIQKANELDLKSEEIAKLKKVIGRIYGVLIVGQAFEMLENKK